MPTAVLDAAPSYTGLPSVPYAEHYRGERLPPNAVSCGSFGGAGQCGIEQDEWVAVEALVPPDATVLEFGARYGTTSCWLAHATRNSGRVVAVEPAARVHEALQAALWWL